MAEPDRAATEPSMHTLAGSLWSVPADEQLEVAQGLTRAGLRWLHWDMSDGSVAARGGFDAERARELSAATGLAAEAHLMVGAPLREVDAWTDFCDLVIVPAEVEDWPRALERIAARGSTPGLAVSPATAPPALPAEVAVLCMSIVPGTAGSAFQESVLEKVDALRQAAPGRRIGIDGGVQRRHAERAWAAGASWLVVGTDLIADGGRSRWADLLRRPGGVSRAG